MKSKSRIWFPSDVCGHLLQQDRKGKWAYHLFSLKDSLLAWFPPDQPIHEKSKPLGMESLTSSKVCPVNLEDHKGASLVNWGIIIKPGSSEPDNQNVLILAADTEALRDLWVKAIHQASIRRADLLDLLSASQVKDVRSVPPSLSDAKREATIQEECEEELEQPPQSGSVDDRQSWETMVSHQPRMGCTSGLLSALGCGPKRRGSFYSSENPSRQSSVSSRQHSAKGSSVDGHIARNSHQVPREEGIGRHRSVQIHCQRFKTSQNWLPEAADVSHTAARISMSGWSTVLSPQQTQPQPQGLTCDREGGVSRSPPLSFISTFKALSPAHASEAIAPRPLDQIQLAQYQSPTALSPVDLKSIETQFQELRDTVKTIHQGLDSTQRQRQASVEAVANRISSIMAVQDKRRGSLRQTGGGSTSSSSDYFY